MRHYSLAPSKTILPGMNTASRIPSRLPPRMSSHIALFISAWDISASLHERECLQISASRMPPRITLFIISLGIAISLYQRGCRQEYSFKMSKNASKNTAIYNLHKCTQKYIGVDVFQVSKNIAILFWNQPMCILWWTLLC